MQPGGSLLCSQEPANGPDPEPKEPVYIFVSHIFKIQFTIISPLSYCKICTMREIF
jgi:hypothetical protein